MIERLRALLARLSGRGVDRREVWILLGAIALGLAVRIAYVLATKGHMLAGDEPEYQGEGQLIVRGDWFYTPLPYGHLHEGMWKAPGYPAFVGLVYSVLGTSVTRLLLVQSLVGPVVIFLVWLLGRRLFDRRIALVGATVAAIYPNMWQWELRMYPEVFALPLGLLVMVLVLGRAAPSGRRAAAVGVLMGLSMLVRPTQFFLFALIAAAWWLAAGPRRAALLTGVAVIAAVLTIAPWSVRNYHVTGHFIPISMQDSAAYGTFNDTAKNDPRLPWAWRPLVPRDLDLLRRSRPLGDGELRSRLQQRAIDYVKAHPSALPEAFFWNGLSRTWDVRRPSHVLAEVEFEGRTRSVAEVGLGMYWILLVAALVALWRLRRRRELVWPLLAGALGASVVFTTAAASRYRLPLEPPMLLLALTVLLALYDRLRGRSPTAQP